MPSELVVYRQLADGEWQTMSSRRHKIACCDCGLVHLLEFRVSRGKIKFRAWRDNRATANRRRSKCHAD